MKNYVKYHLCTFNLSSDTGSQKDAWILSDTDDFAMSK